MNLFQKFTVFEMLLWVMPKFTQKIKVSNDRAAFTTLWLEPWGEDNGMLPDDVFEIIAENVEDTFYFHIDYLNDGILVWSEGDREAYPAIYQNGEQLFCGHNRR